MAIASQKVVVYINDDGDVVPYDTVYTENQGIDGINRCRRRHMVKSTRITVVNSDYAWRRRAR